MKIIVCNDGDVIPDSVPTKLIERISHFSLTSDDKKNISRLDFVGIIIGENDEILVVLPKHCRHSSCNDSLQDVRLMFNVMLKMNRHPLAGTDLEEKHILESDYPFDAFHHIYDYYQQYGLYHSDKTRSFPSPPGKIDWHKTFSRSSYFISEGRISPFPIWYSHITKEDSFLTACMAKAIDSTIERFSVLFPGYQTTGMNDFVHYLTGDDNWIVNQLEKIMEITFRDSTSKLIHSLIDFYSHRNLGEKPSALRYASFDRCWELLVDDYLKRHFSGMNNHGHIVFSSNSQIELQYQVNFKGFNGNDIHQRICIDHYAYDKAKDAQYIIDEKYYQDITDFNYKQFTYTVMLHDYIIHETNRPAARTYSTLIMPSEDFHHGMHYIFEPRFFPLLSDKTSDKRGFNITEEFFDVRKLMEEYLSPPQSHV